MQNRGNLCKCRRNQISIPKCYVSGVNSIFLKYKCIMQFVINRGNEYCFFWTNVKAITTSLAASDRFSSLKKARKPYIWWTEDLLNKPWWVSLLSMKVQKCQFTSILCIATFPIKFRLYHPVRVLFCNSGKEASDFVTLGSILLKER